MSDVVEGWRSEPLKNIAAIERATIQPNAICSGSRYVGLEHIDGDNSAVKSIEVENGELASSKFSFTSQHILYGKLRPYLKKIVLPDFDGICSTDILPILPGPEIDGRYLLYFLRQPHLIELAVARSSGVNLPRLSPKILSEFDVVFPPLDEQRRIAAILDKVDGIRKKRQESIRLTEELLRSTFLEMFGDPVTNPKGWEVKPLSQIAEVKRGRFSPRPRNDPRFYNGEYPFIQTGDIAGTVGVLKKWHQTLNEEGIKISRGFAPGTVVIAIVGATIGATAILGIWAYAPDSVVGIVPYQDQVTSEYVEFTLRFWKPVFLKQAPETARANINLETLRPLGLPIPPLPQQKRFSDIYQKIISLRPKLCLGIDDLFNSLVQRAFRGELTVASKETSGSNNGKKQLSLF